MVANVLFRRWYSETFVGVHSFQRTAMPDAIRFNTLIRQERTLNLLTRCDKTRLRIVINNDTWEKAVVKALKKRKVKVDNPADLRIFLLDYKPYLGSLGTEEQKKQRECKNVVPYLWNNDHRDWKSTRDSLHCHQVFPLKLANVEYDTPKKAKKLFDDLTVTHNWVLMIDCVKTNDMTKATDNSDSDDESEDDADDSAALTAGGGAHGSHTFQGHKLPKAQLKVFECFVADLETQHPLTDTHSSSLCKDQMLTSSDAYLGESYNLEKLIIAPPIHYLARLSNHARAVASIWLEVGDDGTRVFPWQWLHDHTPLPDDSLPRAVQHS